MTLEATVPLTFNYKTSRSAHLLLEKIVVKKCEEATTTNYGLTMLPDTVLKVANTELTKFLLQAELLAIKNGLVFVEKNAILGLRGKPSRYSGYQNKFGNFEGVGVILYDNGE